MLMKNVITPPDFPKTPVGKKAIYWYYRLFDKVASSWKYEGLPETVDRDYMVTYLLTRGYIIFCKDKQNKIRALDGALVGFDCYMYPTSYNIANPVLGDISGTFGTNGIWVKANIYARPINEIIREYALNLAQLDVDFEVNLNNLKLTKVFHTTDEQEAKQFKELYKKVSSGEPAVINSSASSLFSDNTLDVFGADITYLGDKLLADRRTVINDFLTQIGINNTAMEKKERLITAEVDGNNQELKINKDFWLAPQQHCFDKVNKLFGTNIKVKLEGEDEDEKNRFDANEPVLGD